MVHQAAPTTAIDYPVIALIKYWGDIESDLCIPVNGSISMTLDELNTKTAVSFDPRFTDGRFSQNGEGI